VTSSEPSSSSVSSELTEPAGEPLAVALHRATRQLAEAGVPSPRHDAEELAAFVLGTTGPQVRTAALRGDVVPLGESFTELVDQRARRTPLQHLTGQAPFRDLVLDVGPGVFVPRPETELVAGEAVEEARRLVARGDAAVVVDLCTGSGAIALAVATEAPGSQVHAVELSDEACAWARRNVDRWGRELSAPVDLRQGDASTAFDDLDGAVDVVVSNPPYIPPGSEPSDPEVRDHDPRLALYGGGPLGLDVPERVVAAAARLLRPGGLLVMEHADVQQEQVLALLGRSRPTGQPVWDDAAGHGDLAGRPRYVTARRRP
jgi:release factor glutamine methyltransferase